MKTKEELNSIKEEVDNLNIKLAELDEEELEQISGGSTKVTNNEHIDKLNHGICYKCNGELIYYKRWTTGHSYECKKCKERYGLFRDIRGGRKNRSFWNNF